MAHRAAIFRWGRVVSIAALVAGCCCSWACAWSIGGRNGEEIERAPAGQHFMVLPLNVALPLARELVGTTDDVFGAIAGHVRGRGYSIETLSPEKAREHWNSAILEVRESEVLDDDFETAMRVLASRLGESFSFDALILPALVYRSARLKNLRIRWDHVVRRMDTINVSQEASKEQLASQIDTEIPVVSLHVMVFDAGGNQIFEGYGGLDPVSELDMANVVRTNEPKFRLKTERLQEYEHLEEGVAIALGPYLQGN